MIIINHNKIKNSRYYIFINIETKAITNILSLNSSFINKS